MTQTFHGTPEEIADRIVVCTREIFLEHYGMSIRDKWKQASPAQSVNLEVCIRPVDADPDDIHNLYRIDLILHEKEGESRFIDVSYELLVNFAPMKLTRGNLTVHFHPFQWLAVEFEIQQGEMKSLDPLHVWTRKWLLDQGPEEAKPFEFSNVVHHVSHVETDPQGRATFDVDFGTAPKESFWELLDVLEASGITELCVKDANGLSLPPLAG